jgi:hypothetical protein
MGHDPAAGIVRMADYDESQEPEWKAWNEEKRVGEGLGRAVYDAEYGTIDLYVYDEHQSPYSIPMESLRGAEAFVEKLWHLNSKTWATGVVIKNFLDCYKKACAERTKAVVNAPVISDDAM